jgi:hypothetical protein
MSTFDLLEKRHHVKTYRTDKIPPKELIDKALWKAWKTTPSKNNAMAYKVFVFGPDKQKEKELIHDMVYKNHINAENTAIKTGLATRTQEGAFNPFYEHIKYNPYLLSIHCQPREPNKFYQDQVDQGHFFDQAFSERIDKIVDTTCVEVGIFIANLGLYLLEENIDLSYNSCFIRDNQKWLDVGLEHAKYRPVFTMSIGYAEKYRYEKLKELKKTHEDLKPKYENIIEWR